MQGDYVQRKYVLRDYVQGNYMYVQGDGTEKYQLALVTVTEEVWASWRTEWPSRGLLGAGRLIQKRSGGPSHGDDSSFAGRCKGKASIWVR